MRPRDGVRRPSDLHQYTSKQTMPPGGSLPVAPGTAGQGGSGNVARRVEGPSPISSPQAGHTSPTQAQLQAAGCDGPRQPAPARRGASSLPLGGAHIDRPAASMPHRGPGPARHSPRDSAPWDIVHLDYASRSAQRAWSGWTTPGRDSVLRATRRAYHHPAMTPGEKIRRLRTDLGLEREQLATAAGISRWTVERVERDLVHLKAWMLHDVRTGTPRPQRLPPSTRRLRGLPSRRSPSPRTIPRRARRPAVRTSSARRSRRREGLPRGLRRHARPSPLCRSATTVPPEALLLRPPPDLLRAWPAAAHRLGGQPALARAGRPEGPPPAPPPAKAERPHGHSSSSALPAHTLGSAARRLSAIHVAATHVASLPRQPTMEPAAQADGPGGRSPVGARLLCAGES